MATGETLVTPVVQILISKDSIKTRQVTESTLLGGSNTYTPWVTYASTSHTHSISDVTNLQSTLDSKGALVDDIDWSYNSNGFTNGIKLVDKSTDATGKIIIRLKS